MGRPTVEQALPASRRPAGQPLYISVDGVAASGCTPDLFPDLMASAIERRDLSRRAADQGIVTAAAVV